MLSLARQKKDGGVVGLDIESHSIGAVEVRINGAVEVTASAVGPLPPGAFHEGEVLDSDRFAAALKELFAEHKLSKRVRLGVGNQRVVVRMLRLPLIEDPKEMEAAIRFQAQEQISMPMEQAVLEHQVVGGVAAEDGVSPQVDVIVVAARRDMIRSFLEPIRRAGLDPVGIDLSSFGMIRALAGNGGRDASVEPGEEVVEAGNVGATLYCSVGDVTHLAVARGRSCLFTRVSNAGLEPIAARLTSAQGMSAEHATQWLTHVGLELPLEQVEGDPEMVAEARNSLEAGVAALADELRLSLDYYGAQEAARPVEGIVLGGPGSAIAGLAAWMEASLSLPISVARPEPLSRFEPAEAARLTLPYGLALDD